jgi:hypothetical protein
MTIRPGIIFNMKHIRPFVLAALIMGGVLICYGWYHGFVPVFGGPDRARLRHALKLPFVPVGVSIVAADCEAWTDYRYEADLLTTPESFKRLISGRPFEKRDLYREHQITDSNIPDYNAFEVFEIWTWSDGPKDPTPDGYGTQCTVYCNATFDRVLVEYTAD